MKPRLWYSRSSIIQPRLTFAGPLPTPPCTHLVLQPKVHHWACHAGLRAPCLCLCWLSPSSHFTAFSAHAPSQPSGLPSRLSKWIITNSSHFVTSFPGKRIFKWVCKNKSYQFFSHWTHGENSGAHFEVRRSEGLRLRLPMLPDCAEATAPQGWPVVHLAPPYACCWKILVALLLLCKSAFAIWAWQEGEPVCEN